MGGFTIKNSSLKWANVQENWWCTLLFPFNPYRWVKNWHCALYMFDFSRLKNMLILKTKMVCFLSVSMSFVFFFLLGSLFVINQIILIFILFLTTFISSLSSLKTKQEIKKIKNLAFMWLCQSQGPFPQPQSSSTHSTIGQNPGKQKKYIPWCIGFFGRKKKE